MVDKVKLIEKHLEIVSQTYQRMRELQENIIELKEWRSTETNIPISLPTIKIYDMMVYTMATKECQNLASRFEENARKDLARMMDLYENITYDIQRIFSGQKSILKMNIQFHMSYSNNLNTTLRI